MFVLRLGSVLLAVVMLACASMPAPASAALFRVDFSAEVTFAEDLTGLYSYEVGDVLNGYYILDSRASANSSDRGRRSYDDVIIDFKVEGRSPGTDNSVESISGGGSLSFLDNVFRRVDFIDSYEASLTVRDLIWIDDEKTDLTSVDSRFRMEGSHFSTIPSQFIEGTDVYSIPDLDISLVEFFIWNRPSGPPADSLTWHTTINSTVTSMSISPYVAPVPLPAAAWFFLTALTGLYSLRWGLKWKTAA